MMAQKNSNVPPPKNPNFTVVADPR